MKTKQLQSELLMKKEHLPQKCALYVIAHLTGGKNGGIAGMK